MGYLFSYFSYSIGIVVGIQIGKQLNPNYMYLQNKYDKNNYYKNSQMDYRFNK